MGPLSQTYRSVYYDGMSISHEKSAERNVVNGLDPPPDGELICGLDAVSSLWIWLGGSMCGARAVWRPSDFSCRCLHPILPACLSPVLQFEARQEGVDHANLRTLRRASVTPSTISPPKMALLNARSVVNKTFLLNNFFPFTSWILCL